MSLNALRQWIHSKLSYSRRDLTPEEEQVARNLGALGDDIAVQRLLYDSRRGGAAYS